MITGGEGNAKGLSEWGMQGMKINIRDNKSKKIKEPFSKQGPLGF